MDWAWALTCCNRNVVNNFTKLPTIIYWMEMGITRIIALTRHNTTRTRTQIEWNWRRESIICHYKYNIGGDWINSVCAWPKIVREKRKIIMRNDWLTPQLKGVVWSVLFWNPYDEFTCVNCNWKYSTNSCQTLSDSANWIFNEFLRLSDSTETTDFPYLFG